MLVKHLAELHGGTVAAESAERQGSRFIVWLPIRTTAEQPEIMGATATDALMGMQITMETIRKILKTSTKTVRELAQQRTFVHI